jgi:predicted site-specific integrase-resolvase
MDTYLSPAGLSRKLGVAESTMYRWLRAGRIPLPTLLLGAARGYSPEAIREITSWYQTRRSGASREGTCR